MPTPNPLHIRMLAACNLSYDSVALASANPAAASSLYQSIGLVGRPTVIRRNLSPVLPRDLAFLARIPEGVLICCRGTQPPTVANWPKFASSLSDWANDAAAIARTDPEFPGQVHKGFASATFDLWRGESWNPGIRLALEAIQAQGPIAKIYVTGHSKGGPLALMIASLIKGLGANTTQFSTPQTPVEVTTFAGAKPGNMAFRNALLPKLVDCTRYEVDQDVVPQLPPSANAQPIIHTLFPQIGSELATSLINYVSVGTRVSQQGGFLANALGSFGALAGGAAVGALAQSIVRAHAIEPESQYAKLVRRLI